MKLKKGDLFIIIILLLAGASWLLKGYIWTDTQNKEAIIKVDGQIIQKISLKPDSERLEIPLVFSGENDIHSTIITEKGSIWVEESTCPDKVCVKTGKISKPGQSIVCLPAKTVVYIEGEGAEDPKVDDVSY